ncbi:MAG TPA: AAA family ATPase [Candidatus Krumholzibacteria bacterium]|nr:AAA family ATPase [Candidatus Krumholzibacteria bacterium]HPD71752.1 AAA family ATPase [Candidatus Krumholzibacteria bacterium]HRY41315.1 AAA family ATPase [Candidatus Krumholzibacteria bacterium]
MRVIALVNQKGGCGKTTTAVNLAAALTRIGQRVLLVDNDPQGHASLALGLTERDFTLSTFDLYLTTDILVEDARVEIGPRLHLVPAGVELTAVEPKLAGVDGHEKRLRDNFLRSELPYDVILIDCPPAVGLLTLNALLASGEALVPLDASAFSRQAVAKLYETLAVVRDRRGHEVVPRLLLANYDLRSRFARDLRQELGAAYDGALLETIVHPTIRLREAAAAGRSILDHDPGSRAARDYQDLAREIAGQAVDLSVSALDHWTALLHGPEATPEGVHFVVDLPRARDVRLTGSFCGWSREGLPLRRRQDGRWECVVEIGPGAHEYRYIVDGTWLPDPHNANNVTNEFGGANSLVTVA